MACDWRAQWKAVPMIHAALGPWAAGRFRLLVVMLLAGLCQAAGADSVTIQTTTPQVGRGRTAVIEAQARLSNGQPAAGRILLPYVNGKRWGGHEYADANGAAIFRIPLPDVGQAEFKIELKPQTLPDPNEQWIWGTQRLNNQDVYLVTTFTLDSLPSFAYLWISVDDAATAYLNGQEVRQVSGWGYHPPSNVVARLRTGQNVIAVKATNVSEGAGLLLRLDLTQGQQTRSITTSGDWRFFSTQPAGWPSPSPAQGSPVRTYGVASSPPWGTGSTSWPNQLPWASLRTGGTLPPAAVVSNAVTVQVLPRALQMMTYDANHLVGAQWEPWFVDQAIDWTTAQAVPTLGFYQSSDPTVTRQHAIWLMESGIDFWVADWTNHLWGKQHWSERSQSAQNIIDATTAALDALAGLRDEGLRVPRMVILLGLCNGPSTTVEAMNEAMAWLQANYLTNPRYHDLFLPYLGKPLILIFNAGGPGFLAGKPAIDTTYFTVRWMAGQFESNGLQNYGYWSWMDGTLNPPVTRFASQNEAFTSSVGFFAPNGWLYSGAYGRRGGSTYVDLFRKAIGYSPRFLQLHQFNEFAGTPEPLGGGTNGDIFMDSYSAELSDDFEPVSLTAPAYRGTGGWGYLYLNLTRALVDLYHQSPKETTVVVLEQPARNQLVTDWSLPVRWNAIGKTPQSFTIKIGGKVMQQGITGNATTLDLHGVANGPLRLQVVAEGTRSRYRLAYEEDVLPDENLGPATFEQPIRLQIPANKAAARNWILFD